MTTFDRYLLARYLHIVAVFTITAIGLFAIVDGFTNLDEFQHKIDGENGGTLALFLNISKYYLFQSALIVNTAGPTILVISSMCVLALMLKQGEVHPVLAAGVPTYRATFSLVLGLVFVNLLLICNQELVLPRIAHHLQGRRGDMADDAIKVEPQTDFITKIFMSGSGLVPAEQRLDNPEFLLDPMLATSYVALKADFGFYLPAEGKNPAGWHLKNVTPSFQNLPLTEAGRRIIIPQPGTNDVFVLAGLSFDQLNRQASNPSLIGTPSLIQRLQQPSGTVISRRRLLVKLHERLTRPILTLIGLFLVIPLIVRKEKMSVMQQVTNIATCMAVLGVVFGAVLGMQTLGEYGLLRPEQAVWGPLIAAGGLASWLSGVVRT